MCGELRAADPLDGVQGHRRQLQSRDGAFKTKIQKNTPPTRRALLNNRKLKCTASYCAVLLVSATYGKYVWKIEVRVLLILPIFSKHVDSSMKTEKIK